MHKIIELFPFEYKDYKLEYEYITKHFYHLSIKKKKDIKVIIKKKRLRKKTEKKFTEFLFQNYIEEPRVFGVFDRKKLVGIIEGSIETWNNRYRVWNLLVDKKYRRNGYGKALLEHTIEVAKSMGVRAMVLETQSCNVPAIEFYMKQGFHFIGFDTMAYTNNDVENYEVRLEMGMRI